MRTKLLLSILLPHLLPILSGPAQPAQSDVKVVLFQSTQVSGRTLDRTVVYSSFIPSHAIEEDDAAL